MKVNEFENPKIMLWGSETAGQMSLQESLCNIMLSCKICLVPHEMNVRKLVMRPETDVGSELPLPSFDVTHPGLAAVKVDNVLTSDFKPQCQRLNERGTAIKTYSVIPIWILCVGFGQLCERGYFA